MNTVHVFDQDLIRMTFIIGIMTSVLVYERTHLTTGSLVVPGYVAAQLLNPAALFITAGNAVITYVVVARILPKYVAIYGRALFVANIMVSILLALMVEPAFNLLLGSWGIVFDSIGYVVPALIAYDMKRQGPTQTMAAVGGASALAAIPGLVLAGLAPGWVEPLLPVDTGLLAVGQVWFPVAALLSAIVSATMHANYGLRSGGFIGSMYLGLIAVRPAQLAYVILVALLTYVLVVHGLARVMILFGRRKFAVMLTGGSLLSWLILQFLDWVIPGLLSLNGLPIAALFVPALLANDMERTSIPAVATGGLIAGSLALGMLSIVSAIVDGTPAPYGVYPMVLFAGVILLWPQLKGTFAGQVAALRERFRRGPVALELLVELHPHPALIDHSVVVGEASDGFEEHQHAEELSEPDEDPDPIEPSSWDEAAVHTLVHAGTHPRH